MARKLFLIFCALGGFVVASVLSVLIQSLIPNNKPDKPGELAPDPIRQATTQRKQNTTSPPTKQPEPTPQQSQEPQQQQSAPAVTAPEPTPAPAPAAPTRGPGDFDAPAVPAAPVPMAPPPPYHSGPTGPGNM